MKSLFALILITGSVCFADSKATFERYQFEIASLEPEAGDNQPVTPLLMSLPAKDGFAPNVNVTIQIYDQGIEQYIKISRTQYEALNLRIIQETKTDKGEWFIEYAGAFQNRSLHWYSRTIFNGGKVYLITATAPEKEWEALSERLRKVVNSFVLKKQ